MPKRRGCMGGQAHVTYFIGPVLCNSYQSKKNSPEPDFFCITDIFKLI